MQQKFTIELDSYEIANLLGALKYVPNTGDWFNQIIGKIEYQIKDVSNFDYTYNSGMDIPGVKRHLMLMEHKQKHGLK